MSDERETPAVTDPGAPVEELNTADESVQDAVDRAAAINDEPVLAGPADTVDPVAQPAPAESDLAADEPAIVVPAGETAAAGDREVQRREAISRVDTEIDLERPSTPKPGSAKIAEFLEMPSAAAPVVAAAPATVATDAPVRDGEIRISPDHPMASLYMQTPTPPDLRGNRGAGVLISLLATLAFAVLFAGVVALWLAPQYPPSTFLNEALLPAVTSWPFIAGVVAFFIGLVILVLIFGRAGWWAYVIFSLFVGALVWVATSGTVALVGYGADDAQSLAAAFGVTATGITGKIELMLALMFTLPTLGAAIVAREVAVWFGAWIGARGRKVRTKNAELMAEYEAALAEVQAKK